MALIRANSGSGGGGNDGYIFSPKILMAQSAKPIWNNTPFKATEVYLLGTGYYSSVGNIWQFYTNVNPSTGVVDNTKCWRTTDGTNWNDVTSSGLYWTITDTSITMEHTLSGVVSMNCMFLIK